MSLRHTSPQFALDKARDFYRLDLSWTNGTVAVTSVSAVHSKLRPLPTLSPQYFVVARRGDEVLQTVPIKFQGRAHESVRDESGHLVDGAVEVSTGNTSAFIDVTENIDGVDIIDRSGMVVTQLASPSGLASTTM